MLRRRYGRMQLDREYQKQLRSTRGWGINGPRLNEISWFKLLNAKLQRILRLNPSTSQRAAETRATLARVANLLGPPGVSPSSEQCEATLAAMQALDRHAEDGLAERRFSPDQRNALLDLEFALLLSSKAHAQGRPATLGRNGLAKTLYVFDARCLQDDSYRNRGIGKHANHALAALRHTIGKAGKIVLLLNPALGDVDLAASRLADGVIFSPSEVDLSRVALFVCASPMTAEVGPTTPFLLAPHLPTVAVVYDFIPAEFSRRYLPSNTERIRYHARMMALARYKAFLPISRVVADELRHRLKPKKTVPIVVTGVADTLAKKAAGRASALRGQSVPRRYVLAPTGGDPRKNLLVVIAAECRNRYQGMKPNAIVVVGALSTGLIETAKSFARKVGMADQELMFFERIPGRDLSKLHKNALVCVVPSFTEGFSIPIAEAVLRGTPVVASDIPVHRELLGAGSWLSPAASVDGIARAISDILARPKEINKLQRISLGDRANSIAVRNRIVSGFKKSLKKLPTAKSRADPGARRKSNIAVATPWPPQRSGIADFSAYTLDKLSEVADVTVLTNGSTDAAGRHVTIRQISAAAYLDPAYDAVISVLGNSLFHLPALEYLTAIGGPVITHDNRMVEFYNYFYGEDKTARLLSTPEQDVTPADVSGLIMDINRLPTACYREIVRVAHPIIVHSPSLRQRLIKENQVQPILLPYVPYRRPNKIQQESLDSARRRQKLENSVLHIMTFGIVDRRTKAADICVEVLAWLKLWHIKAHLHFVGHVPPIERSALKYLATNNEVADLLVFHGHVDDQLYADLLLAADVAIQLRTSSVLTQSGALLDCSAYGVPTIATNSTVQDIAAPDFVLPTPDMLSPLLIAEAVMKIADRRRTGFAELERQRQEYLHHVSGEDYSKRLLSALDRTTRAVL